MKPGAFLTDYYKYLLCAMRFQCDSLLGTMTKVDGEAAELPREARTPDCLHCGAFPPPDAQVPAPNGSSFPLGGEARLLQRQLRGVSRF